VVGLETVWLGAIEPRISAALAVAQLNEGEDAFFRLRVFETCRFVAHNAALVVLILVAFRFLWMRRHSIIRRWPKWTLLILAAAACGLGGCVRPYDTPEYAEIDTSETGFLIPLEGDSGSQAKFQSEQYLRDLKIAAKRVQITHRWSQEGRLYGSGHWIPVVRLIKVNRSPVTREWTAENNSGTAQKNEAIWIESADSVGFSMGFTCTAFIAEEDAAKFLYWYPSGSLEHVMDSEVRGRIQQMSAEVAAKYPLDSLRERKQEISDAVKKDVTGFFTTRGVTVTTLGMFGGMTYENGEIQKAIDNTIIAQQLKVVNEARFDAQRRENDRVELEANATAERARRIAAGEADVKKIAAAAEAQAIRAVNQALAEAKENPMLIQLRSLEVERARIQQWNGQYPSYYVGTTGGSAPALLLPAPAVPR
ncbi:MAG TPA: SPFH domain-containing protein, partial [Chthoniobacterales bacterium]